MILLTTLPTLTEPEGKHAGRHDRQAHVDNHIVRVTRHVGLAPDPGPGERPPGRGLGGARRERVNGNGVGRAVLELRPGASKQPTRASGRPTRQAMAEAVQPPGQKPHQ